MQRIPDEGNLYHAVRALARLDMYFVLYVLPSTRTLEREIGLRFTDAISFRVRL